MNRKAAYAKTKEATLDALLDNSIYKRETQIIKDLRRHLSRLSSSSLSNLLTIINVRMADAATKERDRLDSHVEHDSITSKGSQ